MACFRICGLGLESLLRLTLRCHLGLGRVEGLARLGESGLGFIKCRLQADNLLRGCLRLG